MDWELCEVEGGGVPPSRVTGLAKGASNSALPGRLDQEEVRINVFPLPLQKSDPFGRYGLHFEGHLPGIKSSANIS